MADSNVCALPKTKDETIEGGGQEAGSKGPSGLEKHIYECRNKCRLKERNDCPAATLLQNPCVMET